MLHLARVSRNGQITVPSHIREWLEVGAGDRIAFSDNDRGEIVVSRAPDGGEARPIPELAEQAERNRLRQDADDELDRSSSEAFAAYMERSRARRRPSHADYD